MEKVPMTRNGYAQLQEEFRWRTQEERPRIIEAIAEARAHGDLSENAEYHAAKEAQGHNEGRVAELEGLISRAQVIDVASMSGDTVKFGATVTLIDEDTEATKVYQIVGDQEGAESRATNHDHLKWQGLEHDAHFAAGENVAAEDHNKHNRNTNEADHSSVSNVFSGVVAWPR